MAEMYSPSDLFARLSGHYPSKSKASQFSRNDRVPGHRGGGHPEAGGGASGRNRGSGPRKPTYRMKKCPALKQCINTLLTLQKQEDTKRLVSQSSHNLKSWRCAAADETSEFDASEEDPPEQQQQQGPKVKDGKKDLEPEVSIGPFRSCPMFHSRCDDACNFPNHLATSVQDMEKSKEYEQYCKSMDSHFNTVQPPKCQKSHPEAKCRGCVTPNIFVQEPMQIYEEYKEKVTYGKIPSNHKIKLEEKMQQWIGSAEYKTWMTTSAAKKYKLQMYETRMGSTAQGSKVLDRFGRPVVANTVRLQYGPAAIASVGKSAYASVSHPRSGRKDRMFGSLHRHRYGMQASNKTSRTIALDDIPFPSENLRYYDNSTIEVDPRLTEIVTNAPHYLNTLKEKEAEMKRVAVQNSYTHPSHLASPIVGRGRINAAMKMKIPIPVVQKPKASTLIRGSNIQKIQPGRIGAANANANTKSVFVSAIRKKPPDATNDMGRGSGDHQKKKTASSVVKAKPTQLPNKGIKKPMLQPKKARSLPISRGGPKKTTAKSATRRTRRFEQNIRTVVLRTPRSKNHPITILDAGGDRV